MGVSPANARLNLEVGPGPYLVAHQAERANISAEPEFNDDQAGGWVSGDGRWKGERSRRGVSESESE